MSVPLKQLFLIACVAFLLAAAAGCAKDTEQDKVKKVITGIQQAAEEKDVRDILANLSKTYRDPQGNDHDAIKGLLLGYFFRHQAVHVYIPDIAVSVEGDAAKADFQAVLTGNPSSGGPVPESLGVHVFAVKLKKEGTEWKVVSATWNQMGEGRQ